MEKIYNYVCYYIIIHFNNNCTYVFVPQLKIKKNMKREEGYYWVRDIYWGWYIAFYNSATSDWNRIGTDVDYENDFFEEIDERRIEREP